MSETIDGLKQRLVGAFVILSLAIIFVPMVFDKPHTVPEVEIKQVPDRPKFETVVIKKPKKLEFNIVEIDPADKKVKPISQIESKPSQPKAKDSSDLSGIAKAKTQKTPKVSHLPIFKNVWMVQLGTFSQSTNAYKLRDRLRSDGFDGHTKEIDVDGVTAIRVFSGPFVNKQEAIRTKKRLDNKYKVNSLVLFFDA